MTTSRETQKLNHLLLRSLVKQVVPLLLPDRLTLLKALISGVAHQMSPKEFEALVAELRLKGERFYDAKLHPGTGRATRHVIGERDLEGR